MMARFATFVPLTPMRVNRLLGDMLDAFPVGPFARETFPPLNVWEDERQVFVEAELPGLTLNDLDISVLGSELTLKGDRKDQPVEGATFQRRERGTGSFCRVIELPVEVDAEAAKATLRDGVLTLTLPKVPSMLPRKIEVKS